LVAPALGDDLLPILLVEVAPLAGEDGRHLELLGDHAEVAAKREADALDRRQVVRDLVECGMERVRALAHRHEEELLLRPDQRVERALLDAEGPGERVHRRAVVAALGEELGGLARQLGTPRGHSCRVSAAAARKISAAASWKPAGRSPAANAAAISSISPTQRQPFAAADRDALADRSERAGSESRHSSWSVSATPSARANDSTARRSAAEAFVHAA